MVDSNGIQKELAGEPYEVGTSTVLRERINPPILTGENIYAIRRGDSEIAEAWFDQQRLHHYTPRKAKQ
ncbi:hypothetical protein L1987_79154 [Smallanthus sonchifolius]|uniref:Uncharacterized protein n=1 Tax=Smallanthus sonchifolius TaxID=185202 RepID=A0ACB8ZFP7_9ASTR|nr:hypothetical protein L1987_79154 [Smallanthus sonchifolius]